MVASGRSRRLRGLVLGVNTISFGIFFLWGTPKSVGGGGTEGMKRKDENMVHAHVQMAVSLGDKSVSIARVKLEPDSSLTNRTTIKLSGMRKFDPKSHVTVVPTLREGFKFDIKDGKICILSRIASDNSKLFGHQSEVVSISYHPRVKGLLLSCLDIVKNPSAPIQVQWSPSGNWLCVKYEMESQFFRYGSNLRNPLGKIRHLASTGISLPISFINDTHVAMGGGSSIMIYRLEYEERLSSLDPLNPPKPRIFECVGSTADINLHSDICAISVLQTVEEPQREIIAGLVEDGTVILWNASSLDVIGSVPIFNPEDQAYVDKPCIVGFPPRSTFGKISRQFTRQNQTMLSSRPAKSPSPPPPPPPRKRLERD
ncbi:hypothetical protein AAMO2058_001657000 [Amorphochlora amoebiformis]